MGTRDASPDELRKRLITTYKEPYRTYTTWNEYEALSEGKR